MIRFCWVGRPGNEQTSTPDVSCRATDVFCARTASVSCESRLDISAPSRSTFAHLSPIPRLIPPRLSDQRGKRGNDGPGERNVRGRRPELAGRVRVVRMLARFRRVRRRRLTLTTHPSHRSAEGVASTTPSVPLFLPGPIECVGRELNPRRRLGRPTSYR